MIVSAKVRLILGFLGAFSPTCAFSAAPVCPPTVSVTQSAVAVPAGWAARDLVASHYLGNVGFLSGPLPANGELVPTSTPIGVFLEAARWDFTPDESELWIGCYYTDTGIALFARLPAGTPSCRVIYAEPGQVVRDVSCAAPH